MPSNHLILCRPLLLLPSIFPSIRIFPNESALRIRWPINWSFTFRISPFNEYSRLISFRIDRFDPLVVQGTLKSFPTPQFKSINSLALSLLYFVLVSIFYILFNFFFNSSRLLKGHLEQDGLTFSPYECGPKNSPAPRPAWLGRSTLLPLDRMGASITHVAKNLGPFALLSGLGTAQSSDPSGSFYKNPLKARSKVSNWDFTGGPVVKTLFSQCRRPRFNLLARKLRSHMPLVWQKKIFCV